MDLILDIHSINRWIIVAVGLIAVVKFLIGRLAQKEYKPLDRAIMGAYAGLMDLQAALGIVLLIDRGFVGRRVEHTVTMVVAIVFTHLLMRRSSDNDAAKFRTNLIAVIGSLAIIVIGLYQLAA